MDWSSFWFLVIFLSIFLVPLVGIPLWLQVHTAKKRKEHRDKLLNQAVLYFLHNPYNPNDSLSVSFHQAFFRDPTAAILIRSIQIIRDSIDIILRSKNKGTIESRIVDINRCAQKVMSLAHLVTPETRVQIQQVIDTNGRLIKTQAYLNLANGNLDKALTMKTEKAKSKYTLLALDVIDEGLSEPESDKEALLELKLRAQQLLTE